MFTTTKCTNFIKLFSTSSTASSITSPTPTITAPTGDGVFDVRISGPAGEVPNFAELVFFGAGANNASGTAKVVLWKQIGTLWIPIRAISLTVTLGNSVGVAGTDVIDTDRFVDTIVADTGGVLNQEILNPGDDTVGHAIMDLQGASRIQVLTAKGTCTNLNALFRGI